jgi:hypothetical protein
MFSSFFQKNTNFDPKSFGKQLYKEADAKIEFEKQKDLKEVKSILDAKLEQNKNVLLQLAKTGET